MPQWPARLQGSSVQNLCSVILLCHVSFHMAVALIVPQETTLPHLRGTSVGMNCSPESSKAWVERMAGLVETACGQRCRAGGGLARHPSPAICWVDKRIMVGGMPMRKECFQGEEKRKAAIPGNMHPVTTATQLALPRNLWRFGVCKDYVTIIMLPAANAIRGWPLEM